MARPLGVAMRVRNPWVRALLILLGWYVLFMADSLKNFRQGLGPTPERCGTPGLSGWGYPRLLSAESGIALALKYMEQATYTAARAPSSASFPNQRAAIMPAYAQRRKGNNGLSTIIFSRLFTWHTEQVPFAENLPRL